MKPIKTMALLLFLATPISLAAVLIYGRQTTTAAEQQIASSIQFREQSEEEVVNLAQDNPQEDTPALLPLVQLTTASSLTEIMEAMTTAHLRYDTLHVVVMTDDAGNSRTEEVWLSQSLGRFRQVVTLQDGHELVNVSDGVFRTIPFENHGYLVIPAHQVSDYPQPTDDARQPNVAYASWIEGELPSIGLLLAPKEYVNIEMNRPETRITLLGEESILGRNTIKLNVMASAGGRNIWVDTVTGIILKSERLTSEGIVAYIQTFTQLEFGLAVPDSLFYVDHSAYDPNWIETMIPPEARNP